MINVQHVSQRYGKVEALRDVNLEIPQGSIYGLIGPNGAGKTSLIRILAALLPATEGQVWFSASLARRLDDVEVGRAPALVAQQVGYMPDFFGVYPDLTSAEYLEFYAGIQRIPRKQRAGIVKDLLELVDLSTQSDTTVETISRGMKQRLSLARALIHDPAVLLLDEPASGLDPSGREELRELLRTLQGLGKTIIISSHALLELAELCTHIAIIQAGRLIDSGELELVMQRQNGGCQLEIRVLEHAFETEQLLKDTAGISNLTSEDGHVIHAVFSGDDRALQALLAQLISREVPVVSFALQDGSSRLEEAFMNATEGSNPS